MAPRLRSALAGLLAAAALVTTTPAPAEAHGIWGHVHVTGWAIENLPPGELRDFFDDPEVMNAALYGAAFTDSGYWPQGGPIQAPARSYGEHTHWEPFIEDFVQWMLVNDPPPWTSLESRKRVAFLMGCASHGLQDEIFDTLFLDQVAEHDASGQDDADPATDGFLELDGHLRFFPTPWIPYDVLLQLYAIPDHDLHDGITEQVIRSANDTMVRAYVNERFGRSIARGYGMTMQDRLPWTRAWYMEPAIPGSLRAEIVPTARYLLALWERLHDRWKEEDLVIFEYPQRPRRLLSGDHESPDSRVTFIFGKGVRPGTTSGTWHDDEETPVPFVRRETRWGGTTRLAYLQPREPLEPGGHYVTTLEPGVTLVDGQSSTHRHTFAFQVECEGSDDTRCPELVDVVIPTIDDPNPPELDAGPGDTGPADVGIDTSEPPDARLPPDVIPDAIDEPDAGAPPDDVDDDTEPTPDAPAPSPDVLTDAGTNDGEELAINPLKPKADDGCSAASPRGYAATLLAFGLLALRRPRRRRSP